MTGGNGFVAQWAERALLEQGWSVFAAGIGASKGTSDVSVLSDRTLGLDDGPQG